MERLLEQDRFITDACSHALRQVCICQTSYEQNYKSKLSVVLLRSDLIGSSTVTLGLLILVNNLLSLPAFNPEPYYCAHAVPLEDCALHYRAGVQEALRLGIHASQRVGLRN